MMKLEALRTAVDRLDDRLVDLLNERARLAREIGHLKRARGLAMYDPGREAQVLARVKNRTRDMAGPLDERAVARLFERIIDEARQLEIADSESGEATQGVKADGRRNGRTRLGGPDRTRRRNAG